MIFVPSHLTVFLSSLKQYGSHGQALTDLKILYSCGEILRNDLVDEIHKYLPKLTIKNQYGPTEASLFSFEYDIPPESSQADIIPIGTLIDNTNAYVLSQSNQLVPIGVIGELHIGGSGIARGYLNRPDLTRDRFIANPFATEADNKWIPC